MFETRVAIGERVAVWRAPTVEPAPRLRVLLPGDGASTRERAMTAAFVPSMQQAARKSVKGPAGRRDTRSTSPRRRVVLPGDPTDIDAAFARWRGHPGDARTETGRALRLGVIDGVTEVGAALMELGCWRTRISALPPGPDLVTALADRPDALAPAPITDPDQALATAWAARDARVGDRVVTGWANAVLETITARARVLSWLQAEQYTDLAMLSRNYPGLAEMLPTEVGLALRTSDAIAGSAISTARTMTLRLPATLEALRAGLIDAGHAMSLASATSTTTADVAAAVEADLLPQVTAPGSTITAEQLRRRAVRRVIIRDPDGAADRHRKARKDRTMTRWAGEDGMAGLKVLAPAEQIAAIWEAATAMADAVKTPWDPRNLGNRRVDCLTGLCLDLLNGITPTPGNPAPAPAPAPAAAAAGPATTTPTEPVAPQPAPTPDATPPDATPRDEAEPDEVQPEAVQPEAVQPEATPRDAAQPGPTAPDATPPDATQPDEVQPEAVQPEATPRDTAQPGPTPPASTTPVPSPPDAPNPGSPSPVPADAAPGTRHPAPGKELDLPRRHGRRPHIQVLVPYTALLGSDDPCELAGHGTITADQARSIAADGTLQRLLYDPATGMILDYGRTRYEPPETLKQFITARDRTCRTPGCLQPADRCQIDHVDPFRPGQPTGGPTSHINLDGKCPHHHRAKDGGGFLNTRDPDGTTYWTTPLGRTYSMTPPQVIEPTDNIDNTDDLDDRFPPELRKTTDFFRQPRPIPPGSDDERNPQGPAAPTTPGPDPVEDEPPF